MHTAFERANLEGEVVCAIDINPTANKVYAHNFPTTNSINGNIEGLTVNKIKKMNIDTIFMSPPCQPFTQLGLQLDIHDPRTKSFIYFLGILPELDIQRLLLENVRGFELSEVHNLFITTLKKCGFHYKEFMLSPNQLGEPNRRRRYYCVAKKEPFDEAAVANLPQNDEVIQDPYTLEKILEDVTTDEYDVPIKMLLNKSKLFDIVYKDSNRSCCFTKSYGRYIEGSGSIFTPKTMAEVDDVYERLNENTQEEIDPETRIKIETELLKSLQFRFFTSREICRLMCFPEDFGFPASVTNRQRYTLLGNSINCKVVAELMKLL